PHDHERAFGARHTPNTIEHRLVPTRIPAEKRDAIGRGNEIVLCDRGGREPKLVKRLDDDPRWRQLHPRESDEVDRAVLDRAKFTHARPPPACPATLAPGSPEDDLRRKPRRCKAMRLRPFTGRSSSPRQEFVER